MNIKSFDRKCLNVFNYGKLFFGYLIRYSQKLLVDSLIELLKIASFTGGCNHGSCHFTGNYKVRCRIWYGQLVAENVCAGELGAALLAVEKKRPLYSVFGSFGILPNEPM